MDNKGFFDNYFQQSRFETSEASFANLYMWRNCYFIEWDFSQGIVALKPEIDEQVSIVPLVGKNSENLGIFLDQCIEYFESRDLPFLLRGVTKDLIEKIEEVKPNTFEFQFSRDVSDYLYSAETLITLRGRKLSRKRNHIKNFKKNNPEYKYADLTEELIPEAIEFLKEWCRKRGCKDDEDLRCERDAALEALNNFKTLELTGGVIIIDNKVEGLTFGEALNADTVIIHMEKGNSEINGVYPVINQDFLLNNWEHMKFVNREEDMGIQELRKAKESYYPLGLVEKHQVTLK